MEAWPVSSQQQRNDKRVREGEALERKEKGKKKIYYCQSTDECRH